ncbi:S1C family serine protease [Streptomyces caatingaensis]|uniref:PDZ domain-containing protein n=1 Tax=Streptomyces caatingaensis TaxID=1678637 RepID=A0A0K9XEY5_9ACTN|nr:trypsin-like peptidase domain-containing protein [Streptomyces caatingaensis]KNB51793.1 hypothetical protein AC230_15845 [Streptomyces caatingaensis]
MDQGRAHWWSRTRRDRDRGGEGAGEAAPLHGPDPYGTPPYGRPGPWAPAPPVQPPAAPAPTAGAQPPLPAPDRALPAGPEPTHPAPGPYTPPGTPAHPRPEARPPRPDHAPPPAAPATRAPEPHPGGDGSHPTPRPYPAAGAPHATPPGVPAAAPQPPAGAPAAQSYPGAGAPHPAPPGVPAAAAPLPPAGFPATPPYADAGGPRPTPQSYPAAGTPHPAPPAAPAATAPHPPAGAPASPPHPGGAGHVSGGGRPPVVGAGVRPGPWQYDPWAVERPQEAVGKGVARKKVVVGAVVVALVAGGVGGGMGAWLERGGGGRHVTLPQAPVEKDDRDPGSVAGIAARALPGVVTLHVRGSSGRGTGTGFVLDKRGHILTNNHVVEPAGDGGEITVTFNGGQTAKATVVGRDGGYDLAVVKVSGVDGLTPLALGNSDSVHVGDSVVAIGAPFDLAGTVTTGIISAKERPITAGGRKQDGSDVSYVDALQTDAPINPGNSGGPLVDSRGRVIGINSAIRSAGGAEAGGGQGGSIGLGFAIPINQAKRVAEELINTGRATHPAIGVTLDMAYQGDGARVNPKGGAGTPVARGGPADRAGIEPGDVIKKVDSSAVHSGQELIVKIRSHRPGDRLTLTVERGGKERTVPLTLGTAGRD